MLEPFGEDIWIVDGPEIIAAMGFHYPTRMVVIRLADRGLLLWSPIAFNEELRDMVDHLGPVRVLIAPNSLHHVHIGDCKQAYPLALLHAAPGLRGKRPDLVIDADLGPRPNTVWAADLDQVVMAGNAITTEIVFFHRKSASALFTDLIQQLPPDWYSGWRAIVARFDLMIAAEPSVPRKFRLAFTDKRAARSALKVVLGWPVEKVIMAHGTPVRSNGAAFLAKAFRWLARYRLPVVGQFEMSFLRGA